MNASTAGGGRRRAKRMVRWYPAAWRVRYGDEMAELLERSLQERPLSVRRGVDVGLGAMAERLMVAGLVGRRAGGPAQARGGALAVLCAWAVFAIAGSALQKYSEHWGDTLGPHQGTVSAHAFPAVMAAGAVGAVAVSAGALVALPALWRWVRAGGAGALRRPLAVAAGVDAAALAGVASLIAVSHIQGQATRNGGSPTDVAIGLALLVLAALAVTTRAVVAVARRLELSRRVLVIEVVAACMATAAMGAVLVAAVAWWVALPPVAASFLETGGPMAPGHVTWADPRMLAVFGAMAPAMALAVYGSIRAVVGLRRAAAA